MTANDANEQCAVDADADANGCECCRGVNGGSEKNEKNKKTKRKRNGATTTHSENEYKQQAIMNKKGILIYFGNFVSF